MKPQTRVRAEIPDVYKWDLGRIFSAWEAWQAALPAARVAGGGVRRPERDAGAGRRRRCSRPSRPSTSSASSPTRSGTTPRSGTTRISATTTSTRGASRCRSCCALAAGHVVVQPRAADDPARRPCARWMDADRRPRASTASPSRTSTASRSTCSTRRASGCCRSSSRFVGDAGRRLRGAVDGRREASRPSRSSDGRQVTVSYGQYRAHPRDSRACRRTARRRFAAYHGMFEAARQHLRGALQRRVPARLVPGAGARLRAPRSRRRCTATTSRRRWSRT